MQYYSINHSIRLILWLCDGVACWLLLCSCDDAYADRSMRQSWKSSQVPCSRSSARRTHWQSRRNGEFCTLRGIQPWDIYCKYTYTCMCMACTYLDSLRQSRNLRIGRPTACVRGLYCMGMWLCPLQDCGAGTGTPRQGWDRGGAWTAAKGEYQ